MSFTYDQAGNRTGMTDGQGSVSYVYDTLSQLKTETRYFSGLGASYAINYDYNLSGELKSVTNPWGAQVGYTHDKTGRVSAVTGAGYAGVSSYITSLGYRASGAAKQVSYGNNRQLSVNYDTRLRPTQWNVAGVLGSNYNYDYFNERSGRVTFAQSLVDATLDREYDYDHVGRLVEAHTGAEARAALYGQGAAADGPYSHSYRYDQWGNMWARVGWGGWNASDSASFTNNRRDGLAYDAAGNLTFDTYTTATYDARGQQASATSPSGALQHMYDGDGLRVKKVENGQPTYYLRSSMLGNQVVCEVSGTGGWTRGYVYLGSQLLAIQDESSVKWVHQDPVTKSQRLTDVYGNVVAGVELDPWGGETNRSWNQTRQPHRYTSYERDVNAWDEAGARTYFGYWNRFAQPDPFDGSYNMADPQSFNRYAYVQNDPVNSVDPTGLVDTCTDIYGNKFECDKSAPVIRIETFAPRWIPDFNLLGFYNQYRTRYVIEDRFSERGARDSKPPQTGQNQQQNQQQERQRQQKGFNDCATKANRTFRTRYLETSAMAVVGGATFGFGLSIFGVGILNCTLD